MFKDFYKIKAAKLVIGGGFALLGLATHIWPLWLVGLVVFIGMERLEDNRKLEAGVEPIKPDHSKDLPPKVGKVVLGIFVILGLLLIYALSIGN